MLRVRVFALGVGVGVGSEVCMPAGDYGCGCVWACVRKCTCPVSGCVWGGGDQAGGMCVFFFFFFF